MSAWQHRESVTDKTPEEWASAYEASTGHRLRKVGRQWEGPCPLCGGDDRFHFQARASGGTVYGCRQCDAPLPELAAALFPGHGTGETGRYAESKPRKRPPTPTEIRESSLWAAFHPGEIRRHPVKALDVLVLEAVAGRFAMWDRAEDWVLTGGLEAQVAACFPAAVRGYHPARRKAWEVYRGLPEHILEWCAAWLLVNSTLPGLRDWIRKHHTTARGKWLLEEVELWDRAAHSGKALQASLTAALDLFDDVEALPITPLQGALLGRLEARVCYLDRGGLHEDGAATYRALTALRQGQREDGSLQLELRLEADADRQAVAALPADGRFPLPHPLPPYHEHFGLAP